jgi:hypothetical protein
MIFVNTVKIECPRLSTARDVSIIGMGIKNVLVLEVKSNAQQYIVGCRPITG